MNYNEYQSFLHKQTKVFRSNVMNNHALMHVNALLKSAEESDAVIQEFPLLDKELTRKVNACKQNIQELSSLSEVFTQVYNLLLPIHNALEKAKEFNTVTAKYHDILQHFIQKTHSNLSLSNIEHDGPEIKDKIKSWDLFNESLVPKVDELVELIKKNKKSVSNIYQEQTVRIENNCQKPLTERDIHSTVYDINVLLNEISSELNYKEATLVLFNDKLTPKLNKLLTMIQHQSSFGMVYVSDEHKRESAKIFENSKQPLTADEINQMIARIDKLQAEIKADLSVKDDKATKIIVGVIAGIVVLILIVWNWAAVVAILSGILQVIGVLLVIGFVLRLVVK